MTDQTAPTTDDVQPNAEEQQEDSATTDDPNPSGNAEAAKWRTKLRSTEAERDTLAERLATYQRADAVRLAGEQLEVPDDLFEIGGVELADLLDENGSVVPELVETAVLGLVTERPRLAKPKGRRGPSPTGSGGRGQSASGSGATWSSALRNR